MERRTSVSSRTGAISRARVVRFAPERTEFMARQRRILHAPSIIEVAENMYSRGILSDLE